MAVPLSRAYKHWNLLATLGALVAIYLPEAAAIPAARAALIVADSEKGGGVDGNRYAAVTLMERGCS